MLVVCRSDLVRKSCFIYLFCQLPGSREISSLYRVLVAGIESRNGSLVRGRGSRDGCSSVVQVSLMQVGPRTAERRAQPEQPHSGHVLASQQLLKAAFAKLSN